MRARAAFSQLQVSVDNNHRLRRGLLALIVFVALAYRLWWAHHANATQPNSALRLTGDEPQYDFLARQLLTGHFFESPARTPLYPMWLGGVYKIFGTSFDVVPYVQTLPGIATVLLTYVLGRRVAGATVGLLAAFAAALSYVLVQHQLHWMTEVLYTPALLVVCITLWDAWHARNRVLQRWAWAGAAVGVANLIRPTALLLPFFVGLVLIWLRRRSGPRRAAKAAGVYLASSLFVVMPWVARNYVQYHALFPLQTSHAQLWQGSPEFFTLVRDRGLTYTDVWTKVIDGPLGRGHDLSTLSGDRWWTDRALTSISDAPLTYLRYSAEKTVTYWLGDPEADWGGHIPLDYSGLRCQYPFHDGERLVCTFGYRWVEGVQIWAARALPIVALAALIVMRRKWRLFAPLLIVLIYFDLLHALTFEVARLSEPLQPVLLVIIASAVTSLVTGRGPVPRSEPGNQEDDGEPVAGSARSALP